MPDGHDPHQPSWSIDRPLPTLPASPTVTPCARRPAMYDEDAPLRIKKAAARACRRDCDQLDACTALLGSLGADVSGVMAGVIFPRGWRHIP